MYIYIYLLIEGVLASLLCQDGKFRNTVLYSENQRFTSTVLQTGNYCRFNLEAKILNKSKKATIMQIVTFQL